jgi:hypothetical protein
MIFCKRSNIRALLAAKLTRLALLRAGDLIHLSPVGEEETEAGRSKIAI